jgi:CDP-glycerol glycerophosphotransferase
VLSANPSAGQQDCKWNIAFMPTWRASRANLAEASLEHLYGLRELFALLDENLPHTMTVWVRLHPLLRSAQYLRSYRRIRPFPEDIEPYKHLATCDALVTDYSSVLFDFAATRRPIFLYTPDEGAYRKERDFCLDIDTLPFQRFATPSELLESLAGLADCLPQASVAYQDFIAEYANLDCGQSAEALCSQFFLRRTSIETIKFLPDPRRRTLLIYCGSLLNNGITASLKTLVSLVDKQLYNIVLWFDVVPAVTNAADYIRQLGQDVAYIPTNSVLMVSQNEGMRLLLREITGVRRIFTGPRSQELWKREWCRLFATAHFDAVVHFSGYERRVSHLLSICPARRIIFVHNEMTEEVEKKGIDQEALETAYEKADVIAMVREGLDQKYNSRVSDTSARSMFIPNTLRTNYGELSSAPLLNSLATDGDQGMASKLECMVGQQGAFRFLNLARFAVEKGQERLIDAFERLWADSPRSQLFMLGGYGATYRQLSRRVQSSPASESIFIGLGSDNPYPLVVRMDTMVLASYYEGRPLVLYEAFALGLSVLSTDIPGPAEILNQGYGLVVENSIEGLVEGMRAALRGEIPIRDYDIEAHNRFALSQFYKAVGD